MLIFASPNLLRSGLLGLCSALLVGVLLAPAAAANEKKFALLIQNDAYPDGDQDKSADEDVATLAASLKGDGFEVQLARNASRQALHASLTAFAAKISPRSVALLYYKGIAIQTSRLNYLVPIDASIWSEDDVRRDGTSLDRLMSDLGKRGAGVKIAIVDAARSNPFERRFRLVAAGLAPTRPPAGSLVIFAAAPNVVAEPEKRPVSLFMSQLADQLDVAGDAGTAFARTREGVAKLSNGRELPWVSSTLAAPFDFAKPVDAAKPMEPAKPIEPTKPSAAAEPGSASRPAPATPSVAAAVQSKPSPSEPPPSNPSPPPPQPAPATTGQSAALVPPKPPAAAQSPPATPPSSDAPANPGPRPALPRPGSTFTECGRCPDMTAVPAASFEMGSGTTPFDRPVHKVTIAKPFAISLVPVTRDEWALCVEEGGCEPPPQAEGAPTGRHPVVNVSWPDAQRYAAFLSKKTGKRYRLPTEAEWEYAARGGTTTAFAWGDAAGIGQANCSDCGGTGGRLEPQPVGSYPKNKFGLFDMAGNVAQWLADCWRLTYRGAAPDGSAPATSSCDLRVVRGGSFETTSAYIKPTARFRAAPDTRSRSIGFRVARDL